MLLSTIAFYILSFIYKYDWMEITAVTLLTIFFHSCVRPFTGVVIDLIYNNKMNYKRKWFKEKKFEKGLYKFLLVKKWKNFIPTYNKDQFDFNSKSIEDLIGATCQAEVIHELMFLESFIPLLLIIPYGKPLVFIITSVICAVIELIFIIVQRYNRPRLINFMYVQKRREIKQTLREIIRSSL